MDINKNTRFYITLLTSCWLLGLAGEAFYTPAMPAITQNLAVSSTLVKYTISFFILGKAVSMFLCSPIAEGFGRRQFIIVGLVLFSVGSLFCSLSQSIDLLLTGRLLEGLGCSMIILMGRAIINDSFEQKRAANLFSYIFIGNAVGIITLPILGGYVAAYTGWRGIFYILTLYGLCILFIIWRYLPETNPGASLRTLHARIILNNYKTIIKNASFWGFLLCLVFVMSGEKAYTTSSAFLFISKAGLSKVSYGYLTAATWLAHLIGTLICGRLVLKQGIDRIMAIGVAIISFAALAMLLCNAIHIMSFVLFAILMFIYMLGTGFIITLAAVGIVRPFPNLIGFATAFAMCLEFIIAALISFAVSQHSSSIAPVADIIGIMGLLTFVCWFFLIRRTSLKYASPT